jgi:hypothetical protein
MASSDEGYSARVNLYLLIAGTRISLGQVLPDSVVLQQECEPMPASQGTIVISVDGREDRMDAFFPHGIGNDGLMAAYY